MAGVVGASLALIGFGSRTKNRTSRENQLAAFEAMVARDWDRFYRFAYRLCGNRDDAEDLLSESMIDALRDFDRYRGEGFDKWMFRILTTNRIDMTRRAKVRKSESLDTAWLGADGERHTRDVVDDQADPERLIVNAMYSEPVQKALDALPEDFRAAVLLCDVEQMEYHEIAQALNIPVGTVRSRISRARAHMRKTLSAMSWKG